MPNLHSQLLSLAARENLTAYGISMAISAETDPTNKERKACEKRWQRALKGDNVRLQDIEADLIALGYSLKIEKQ